MYAFEKHGINKATTILGFCKKHDNKLFEPFEKNLFSGQYDQIYAITFRSLCREFFQKKCLDLYYAELKSGCLKIDKTGYTRSPKFNHVIKKNKKCYEDLKFLYEQLKEKSKIKFFIMKTTRLPVSSTGVLFPLLDCQGNKIQKENMRQLGFIYSVINLKNYSYNELNLLKNI